MPPLDGSLERHAGRHALTRRVYLRLLGVTHLVAFASLWVQVHGLIGEGGIAPAVEYLDRVRAYFEGEGLGFPWWKVPTLAWFGAGDAALHVLCGGGVALALLLIVGIAPALALIGLWALYLSLVTIGDVFLSYQWDALLLETTLLSVFLAPWGLRPRPDAPPPRVAVWLPRIVLFKLMLASGIVKTNHPGTWRDLTALDFHFWTQPIPHVVAWYAHQLPEWFRHLSVVATLAIELVGPFLIFLNPRGWRLGLFAGAVALVTWLGDGRLGPFGVGALVVVALLLDERIVRRFLPPGQHAPDEARLGAFVAFAGLMGVIALTGNYGFFNFLTFTLCVMLLDDAFLLHVIRGRWPRRLLGLPVPPRVPVGAPAPVADPPAPGARPLPARPAMAAAWAFTLVAVPLTLLRLTALLPRDLRVEARHAVIEGDATAAQRLLDAVEDLRGPVLGAVGPLSSFNGYGLFARITTERPEVIVEGSNDGRTWKPYVFHWKPGDPGRAPGWAALHMPRLDWQLWFAALRGECRNAPWFLGFVRRLLEGEPRVRALLAEDPFADAPPRFVRARLTQYTFTTDEERAATGAWWRVRPAGQFCPPLTREAFR